MILTLLALLSQPPLRVMSQTVGVKFIIVDLEA
jgi:hypothetical protein